MAGCIARRDPGLSRGEDFAGVRLRHRGRRRGGMRARQPAERGPSEAVALVEAGPERQLREGAVAHPARLRRASWRRRSRSSADRSSCRGSRASPSRGCRAALIALPRGHGIGGSTNVNGQIFIRGQREDFDHWRDDSAVAGWGYDDLLPYFRKLETLRGTGRAQAASRHVEINGKPLSEQVDPAYHGTDGPVNIAQPRSINPMTERVPRGGEAGRVRADRGLQRRAAERLRLLHLHPRSAAARERRRSPISIRSAHRPNLTILADRPVTRVLMEGKRAVGVAWDNWRRAGRGAGPRGDPQRRARSCRRSC